MTKVLADQRGALAEILDVAPVALSNLPNTYNGSSGTLDGRSNLNELTQPPLVMVCRLLKQTPCALAKVGDLCDPVASILDGTVKLLSIAQTVNALQNGQLPPSPLPVVALVPAT